MSKIARIVNGKIVYSDEHAPVVSPNETEARARREGMKTKHRKELLQKNQTDYYKAYPEQAENLSDDVRRLLS
jgi:hypothetical protein